MNELHLFAGAGGGILGGLLLGHTTVCAVEIEPYCRKILLQRQRDGILPKFPIWDDVCTLDGTSWRGKVDVVCGGFPCSDISAAGKGAGITGERSGLWAEMSRIIGEIRPKYAFVENSPMLTVRGLGRVLGDLSEMGFDARWGVVGAHHAGAPHKRDRIWILAYPACSGPRVIRDQIGKERAFSSNELSGIRRGILRKDRREKGHVSNTSSQRGCSRNTQWEYAEDAMESSRHTRDNARRVGWWDFEPNVGRVAHGVDHRVHRLKAIGNGQVPIVAALAWRLLGGPMK
jgi:DNA (cytosine-5)-methyltransferase 1